MEAGVCDSIREDLGTRTGIEAEGELEEIVVNISIDVVGKGGQVVAVGVGSSGQGSRKRIDSGSSRRNVVVQSEENGVISNEVREAGRLGLVHAEVHSGDIGCNRQNDGRLAVRARIGISSDRCPGRESRRIQGVGTIAVSRGEGLVEIEDAIVVQIEEDLHSRKRKLGRVLDSIGVRIHPDIISNAGVAQITEVHIGAVLIRGEDNGRDIGSANAIKIVACGHSGREGRAINRDGVGARSNSGDRVGTRAAGDGGRSARSIDAALRQGHRPTRARRVGLSRVDPMVSGEVELL